MLTKYKKPKRRVRFAVSLDDARRTAQHQRLGQQQSILSEEDVRARWYSAKEQHGFKVNAFVLDMFLQRRFGRCARGMEGLTKERVLYKKRTIQSVLLAYKLYGNESPEYVAEAYRQNSCWNATVAATQASADFIEACEGNGRKRRTC